MKLNFVKAWATYCKYCKACGVRPDPIKEFAEDYKFNYRYGFGHENTNWNYNDPEVLATISRVK